MAITTWDDDIGANVVNPLDPLLGYQLRRASSVMMVDLTRSLADLELRSTDASVILLIEDNPDITQSELGRVLGIQRANMAPLTATLSDRGIIDRAPADGRSQALRLSRDGTALAHQVRQRIADHEARFLPDVSPQERTMLTKMLRRMWSG